MGIYLVVARFAWVWFLLRIILVFITHASPCVDFLPWLFSGKGAILTLPISLCDVEYAKLESSARRSSVTETTRSYLTFSWFHSLDTFRSKICTDSKTLNANLQEAVEHAQATGHVNFQEYRWERLRYQHSNIYPKFFMSSIIPSTLNFMV